MTHIALISAAPTPWDEEGRLGGNNSLPLSTDGEIALTRLVVSFDFEVNSIYTCRSHEACEQAAQIVARRFSLRVRDQELLHPVSLGLWQGLTRDELRRRHPKVFGQWEEDPLSVTPPEGEPVADAAERLREGVQKVLRRNRDTTVALVLRPMSLRIVAAILRGQDLQSAAPHLHTPIPMERIDIQQPA